MRGFGWVVVDRSCSGGGEFSDFAGLEWDFGGRCGVFTELFYGGSSGDRGGLRRRMVHG